jgi:predicted HicB family RNase H-like nuclease
MEDTAMYITSEKAEITANEKDDIFGGALVTLLGVELPVGDVR